MYLFSIFLLLFILNKFHSDLSSLSEWLLGMLIYFSQQAHTVYVSFKILPWINSWKVLTCLKLMKNYSFIESLSVKFFINCWICYSFKSPVCSMILKERREGIYTKPFFFSLPYKLKHFRLIYIDFLLLFLSFKCWVWLKLWELVMDREVLQSMGSQKAGYNWATELMIKDIDSFSQL